MRTTDRAARRTRKVPGLVPGVLLTVLALASVAVAAWIDLQTTPAARVAVQMGFGSINAVIGALVTLPAAVVVAVRPRQRVGWVLGALGVVWAVDGALESYAALAWTLGAPGLELAVWYVARFGAVLLLLVATLLVLYPTGRLPGGRLGTAGRVVLAAAAALPLALLLAPDSVAFVDTPVAGVDTEVVTLPLGDDAWTVLLTLCQASTLLAIVASAALAFLRHRRADGLERLQLRWLLWGGTVVVLAVALFALLGNGAATDVVLSAAVLVISGSVAVGVLRPGLGDVDALVASTLTYGGVAGLVVALDLAVLATVDDLLGARMDQREVTLLVLVVAVAVYGPLRSWLGSGVRRALLGRRGDRYDVVSTFAARLEATGTVAEQLPALTEAVATTFKVPFVRVEVVLPGGRSLAAEHGTRGARAHSLDIGYRGERVGRLELSQHGFRAMLSSRDRSLLVDLVRQAAIAIRADLLAEEVQGSRERLVLAREEDRRRIRRDLHDGLGPALSGVALRLQAAHNVLEADPGRAREQVETARVEVQDALGDVRRLVHDLRPPALDDLGLVAAVRQQADRLQPAVRVEVRAGDVAGAPAAVEVAAYRIVAEALTNVVKHAEATRVQVSLERREEAMLVEVADDGRGIGEDVRAGVGLLSLRERSEELGGRCEVRCPEDGGTLVQAWLPWAAGGGDDG